MNLQTITDARGSLTVIERLPFAIRRAYYLHGVDPNAIRGGHAHRALRRLMVAVHGRFEVAIDGKVQSLSDPRQGLLIEPLQWVSMSGFSVDAVCLVLASEEHDEGDCIRSWDEFSRLKREQEASKWVAENAL